MALQGEKDGEISDAEFSDNEQKKKKRVKRKNPRKVVEEEVSGDVEDRGVVYLSHIPHGFYEPQMRHFFQQFGKVTRLKLWRSKKSGKSRGFAYIEFEYADVAKIVGDTMNNYLMFQKLLKCHFIPNDKLSASAFSNSERPFIKPYHREASARRHNSLLNADTAHIIKSQRRLVQKEGRRKKKMAALGIECNLPGYTAEWEHIKKAHAIVSEKRKVEALRQKEIDLRKQEALKRAKQKAKLLSKKRRMGKKLKRRAEKEKANEEKLQEEGSKKSPKRKSSDSQDAAVSSSNKAEGQPRKKKGRISTPVSPSPKVSSSASSKEDEEAKPSRSKLRRSGRILSKSGETLTASPVAKLSSETPKITRAATAAAKRTSTPKSTAKSLAKKGSSSSTTAAPKTPAGRRKELTETKTPQSGIKTKTPKTKLSSDEVESKDTSTEEEMKIKEFAGIKLPGSGKKEGSSEKGGKKQQDISIHGDQLLIF